MIGLPVLLALTASIESPHAQSPVRKKAVRLIAVGDILLAGPMGGLMSKKGADFPFAKMKPIFAKADLVFGNLECSISMRGAPIPKQFNFRADPKLVPVLKRTGFHIVSQANNHVWDFGRDALIDSVRIVRKSGVQTVGAGANSAEAHRLVILHRNGMKIGFLAYLGLIPALIPESPTAPSLSMASEAGIRRDIEAARNQVDFLLVSLHAGQEMASKITARQKTFAHAAIDAGADMVIGHHPHVTQISETYRGKQIFYSLGNFVFSTAGRGSGSVLTAMLYPDGRIAAKQLPLDLSGAQPKLKRQARKPSDRRTR